MSAHPVTVARGEMTIAELSAKADVPALTIARLEGGLTETPMRRTLGKLAAALDTEPTALALAIAQHNHAEQAKSAEAPA